jgi:Protein phosphatase 2C
MTWRAIGKSCTGIAHIRAEEPCGDSIHFSNHFYENLKQEVLICCIGDGAGSSMHGDWASKHTTRSLIAAIELALGRDFISEQDIIAAVKKIYAEIEGIAREARFELNDYSCTLLGCVAFESETVCFQIGDGAIVMGDGTGNYETVWWPDNGEYANSTSYLIDDPEFNNLRIKTIKEQAREIAIFTDGLQMLTLNYHSQRAHAPFFTAIFSSLHRAESDWDEALLSGKLEEYLNSDLINSKTSDDKTLFLAYRPQTELL